MRRILLLLFVLLPALTSAQVVYTTEPQDFAYIADRNFLFHAEFEERDYLKVLTCDDQVFVEMDPIRMRCQAGLNDAMWAYYVTREDLGLSYFEFRQEDGDGEIRVDSIVYFLILDDGVRRAELSQYKGDGQFSAGQHIAVRNVSIKRPGRSDAQLGFGYNAAPQRISLEADGGAASYNGQAGVLSIPDLKVGSDRYDVQMKKSGAGLNFEVSSARKQ